MKTPSLATLTFLSILLPISAQAQALDNGSGYNGPVRTGSSIPTFSDRAFTKVEVEEALLKCGVRTLSEVLAQLLRRDGVQLKEDSVELTFNPFASSRLAEALFASRVDADLNHLPAGEYSSGFREGLSRPAGFTYDILASIQASHTPEFGHQILSEKWRPAKQFARLHFDVRSYINDEALDWKDDERFFDFRAEDFPVLAYDQEVKDAIYDDLGREVKSKTLLKNLRILSPSKTAVVALTNAKTGKPTSLKVNIQSYVDCLGAELQR